MPRGQGKKYQNALKEYDQAKAYSLEESVIILKKFAKKKFDETVELHVNLGVDSRQSDQQVRGTVALPHGTGRKVRILVLCGADKVNEAREAGADFAGAVDLVDKIVNENWVDYDKVIATPDMMRHVGKLGKVLGPRGLMPNPKVGTVTPNIAQAVKALKAGQVEYRVDKGNVVHVGAGKVSFEPQQLKENLLVVLNAIVKAKPATSKGIYLKKVNLASTMGPGVKVDLTHLTRELDEAKAAKLLA